MSYAISPGLREDELNEWLKLARQRYGTYKSGSINYKRANVAPIVMCAVVAEGQILLVKRGEHLSDAKGYWSLVNGFIDQEIPIWAIACQELREELQLQVDKTQIKVGESYTLDNPREIRKYIVFPCLIELDEKPSIVLDHENTDYVWIVRNELKKYETLDDLEYALDHALMLSQ